MIGIEPLEEFILFFGGQFFEERAGFEFLEADAAAFVRIQFPQALHGRALVAMGSGHAAEFFAAEFAICVFIQALEEMQAFFFRQILDARHRIEFFFRDEAIVVLVRGLPCLSERSLRATLAATAVIRWW